MNVVVCLWAAEPCSVKFVISATLKSSKVVTAELCLEKDVKHYPMTETSLWKWICVSKDNTNTTRKVSFDSVVSEKSKLFEVKVFTLGRVEG